VVFGTDGKPTVSVSETIKLPIESQVLSEDNII
jgi:hypothetical protein